MPQIVSSRPTAFRGALGAPQDITLGLARLRTARRGSLEDQRAAETALARLYQLHPAHRDTIVRELTPIADGIAQRFYRGGEPMEDLRQVAALGLLKALQRFDGSRQTSFIAFAIPTIRGELRRHYRDHTWAAHVPRGDQELAQRVLATRRRLHAAAAREPTVDEVAEELGVRAEAVVEGLTAAGAMRALSLDLPAGDDSAGAPQAPGENLGGDWDTGFERAEERIEIRRLTRELSERDRVMLALRYGRGYSQSRIARRIGISQMQVSRCLRRILDDLSEAAGSPAVPGKQG
jgi:RNA polymerase sigma-B factor